MLPQGRNFSSILILSNGRQSLRHPPQTHRPSLSSFPPLHWKPQAAEFHFSIRTSSLTRTTMKNETTKAKNTAHTIKLEAELVCPFLPLLQFTTYGLDTNRPDHRDYMATYFTGRDEGQRHCILTPRCVQISSAHNVRDSRNPRDTVL